MYFSLKPWSKHLGTRVNWAQRHTLLNELIFYLLKKLRYVVVRAYFCCPPLPYAVLIVLKQNLNAERQYCIGGKGRENIPHFDEL